MLRSFKNYLKVEYRNLPDLIDFDLLYEMALERQVARMPVNIDKDDIEFLSQFTNYNHWGEALYQRYNLLFDKIEQMHNVKDARGFRTLIEIIKDFLQERSKENRKRLMDLMEPFNMNQNEIDNIDTSTPIEEIEELSDEELDYLAEKYAHDHYSAKTEKDTNQIQGDDEKDVHSFEFHAKTYEPREGQKASQKGSGSIKEKITVKAKPFLVRLYHKLERTRGEDHIQGSGLEGKGKYGFEMRDPRRGMFRDPHATRGMVFPTLKSTNEVVKRWLELNSHRIFGDYGPDVKWMDSGFEDTFTRDEALRYFRKLVERDKGCSAKGTSIADKFEKSKDQKNAAIEAEALKCLVHAMRTDPDNRMFRGPAYPDHPDGLPMTLTTTKVRGKNKQRDNVNPPPLYLPFKKNEDGKWIPVVHPASFYRRIEDAQRKVIGYEKVDLDRDPAGQEISKDAALNINQNTSARRRLIAGTPEYREAYDKVIRSQPQADIYGRESPEGAMRLFIIKGVLNCINNKNCGQKTDHEIAIMKRKIPEIYAFAEKYVIDHFGDDDFYCKDKEGNKVFCQTKKLHKKCEKIANTATSLLSQKDFGGGGGTFRQRAFSDNLRKSREKKPLEKTRIQFIGNFLDFPYSPENFSNYLHDIQTLKSLASTEQQNAERIISRRKETSFAKDELGTLLSNSIAKEKVLIEDIKYILTAIYRSVNKISQEVAQQNADSQIKSWEEDKLSPEQMVDAIASLPVYKEMEKESSKPIRTSASMPNLVLQREIRSAKEDFEEDLKTHKVDSPQMRGKYAPPFLPHYDKQEEEEQYSQYVKNRAKELASDPALSSDKEGLFFVLKNVQKELNNLLGINERQSTPVDLKLTPNKKLPELLKNEMTPQNLFDIIFNSSFKLYGTESWTNKMKGHLESMKNKFTKSDYDKMKNTLDEVEKYVKEREKEADDYIIKYKPKN